MKIPRILHALAPGLLFLCLLSPTGTAQLIKPDLWVTSVSTSTYTYKEGTSVSVTFIVRQEKALTSSAACSCGVYLSYNSTISTSDRLVATASIPKLGNNQTVKKTVYFTVPNMGDGTRYVGVYADRTRIVNETDETNNWRSVSVNCITRKANILVKSIKCSSYDLSPGNKITFTTVMNSNGDLAVPAGLKATYYLSLDPYVTSTDMALGTFLLPGQAAVATSGNLVHELTVPKLPVCGHCYLGVILDSTNALKEHSENDNVSTYSAATRLPLTFYSDSPGLSQGKSFLGSSSGDRFGWRVADAGDCNGDGHNDIIFGAYGYSSQRGLARVISGKDGTTLHTVLGVTAGDGVGYSVAGAGDVDGDGYRDFIAGAPFASPNGSQSGTVKVYSGRTGSVLHTVNGTAAGEWTGFDVTGMGDTDGDGYDDFAVSVPGYKSTLGAVQIHSGRTGALRLRLTYVSSALFGRSLASIADVNGDRVRDVLIGGYGYSSSTGSATVMSGADGKLIKFLVGPATGTVYGFSVADAGDVNDDGTGDVIVGGHGYSGGRGGAWVLSGKDWSQLALHVGAQTNTYLGYRVAGAGDLNCDGHADVIAGFQTQQIFSGKDKQPLCAFVGTDATSIRDLNADGVPDIVIGNHLETVSGKSSAGSVRVFTSTGKTTGSTYTYGAGCPGFANKLPRHDFLGAPNIGRKVTVQLWAVQPNTQVALIIGFARTAIDFGLYGAPGCTSYAYPSPGLQLMLKANSAGRLDLPIKMPNQAKLVGQTLYTTCWAADPQANALQVVTANGVTINVGKLQP